MVEGTWPMCRGRFSIGCVTPTTGLSLNVDSALDEWINGFRRNGCGRKKSGELLPRTDGEFECALRRSLGESRGREMAYSWTGVHFENDDCVIFIETGMGTLVRSFSSSADVCN